MGSPASWIGSGRWGFFRDTRRGWIAGVCAGIAERVGIKPLWVRLGFVGLCFIDRAIPAVLLYIVLTVILQRQSGAPQGAPAASYFADRFQAAPPGLAVPGGGVGELSARFAALDGRLNRLEAAVTAEDLLLRRKFRDLGG